MLPYAMVLCVLVCFMCASGFCPHADDDSASESSDSGLRGDVVSSAEERHVEQKMDTSRSTTAPTGSTTAPSAACDSSIAVGNFTWLTDVFKSIK